MQPLYKNDLKPMVSLSSFQNQSITKLLEDIDSNKLSLVENECLCCNPNPENDVIISEKDRYGIPVKNVICSRCGLIRSKVIFTEESNIIFYKYYYRDIYVGLSKPNENFFNDQKERGKIFFSLVKKHIKLTEVQHLLEIGCGSGGIMFPFFEAGISCKGIDFNEDYLKYGRNKGLTLLYGDYKDKIDNNSIDLLILSHVMEHFTNPIEEMIEVIKKVKINKYLLIEVPGIFYMDKVYLNPILYLQNAHVFNYYYYYLKVFYEKLGLEIIYGDERCTFLLKKKENWIEPKLDCIYENALKIYPEKIRKFILKTHFQYKYSLSFYVWKIRIIKLLDFLGIKETIKTLLKKE
jgi:SAM-dependent methyltransferase